MVVPEHKEICVSAHCVFGVKKYNEYYQSTIAHRNVRKGAEHGNDRK